MVALLANVISSFKCLLSSPVVSSLASVSLHYLSKSAPVSHPWNLPLPPVMHLELSEDFIGKFDEILVIGDIHGCYDELMQLLAIVNSDNNNESQFTANDQNNNNRKILKLFVGDLVNKGPKSKEVIQYMIDNSDTCLSVRGNHDEVVIREYLKYFKNNTSLIAKNEWVKHLSQQHFDYLISLPYTIRIPILNILVVHAGLVPSIPLHSQKIINMVNMRNLVINNNNMNCMEATPNDKIGEAWAPNWTGPQHIYFGHDAKRKLQKNMYATGLDTGCVYGNSLSAVFAFGPRKGIYMSVNASKVYSPP